MADFGGALDWVGSGNAAATATETPVAEPTPAQPVETPVTQTPEAPVQVETPAPAEDFSRYRDVVDQFGGEDGVRQFQSLFKAITSLEQDQGKIGGGIVDGLKQLLSPDQFGAMVMDLHGQFGELLAEQFVADHPEWLQGKMLQPQADDGYDDESEQQPELTAREQQMQQQLQQMQAQLQQLTGAQQQISQQQLRQVTDKEVFGSIVDSTFEQLEGWEDKDLQTALNIAMAEFGRDQKAVEAYQLTMRYNQTKQPVLANQSLRAKQAFSGYLKDAIELVGLRRQNAIKSAATVPPKRAEIGTTAPVPNTAHPQAEVQNGKEFWNANQLMDAVMARVKAQHAQR